MENHADLAIEKLDSIISEFNTFLSTKGMASEADTRVKVVDRILKEVCQWPETQLSREDKVESGYTDYQLKVRNVPAVTVEAKKEGIAFVLPSTVIGKSLKLKARQENLWVNSGSGSSPIVRNSAILRTS